MYGGVELGEQRRESGDKRGGEGQGQMPLAFTSKGETVEHYSSTAGDLQSPKQRRDTLHLKFLGRWFELL